MTAITQLLQGAVADLGVLGREYWALSKLDLKASGKAAARGGVCIGVAGILSMVGLCQITYGLIGLIVADYGRLNALIVVIAGVLSLIVAAILGYVAYRAFKHAWSYAQRSATKPTSFFKFGPTPSADAGDTSYFGDSGAKRPFTSSPLREDIH